jgi:hypothetical protein
MRAAAAHQRILSLCIGILAAADGLMSLRISFPSLFLFHFVNHRILADLQLLVHIAVVIDYVVAFLFSCELRNTFTIR